MKANFLMENGMEKERNLIIRFRVNIYLKENFLMVRNGLEFVMIVLVIFNIN